MKTKVKGVKQKESRLLFYAFCVTLKMSVETVEVYGSGSPMKNYEDVKVLKAMVLIKLPKGGVYWRREFRTVWLQ